MLGRFEILYTTSNLARYNTIPREGHLKAALRLFGYLKNFIKARNVFDASEPDLTTYNSVNHKWDELYPGGKE